MRVQGVVDVPADSLAASTDTPVGVLLARRVQIGLGWIILGRILSWPFKNLRESAALAPGLAAAAGFRSVGWGLAVATAAAFLVLACQMGWAVFRGSETHIPSILQAMSRRRRLAARWATICYRVKLTASDEDGRRYVPALDRFRYGPAEVSARVSTSELAVDASVLTKHAPGLAAGLGCDRVIFDIYSNRGGTVAFQWGRHLRREIRISDVPNTGTWERVAFGIDERGEAVTIPSNKSILCVAESGAGKSNAAWAILAGYIRAVGADRIRVRVLDPGQIEFKALKDRLESWEKAGKPEGRRGICHQYETSAESAELKPFWEKLDLALEARMAAVLQAGVREHVPTPADPLDILVIDETLLVARELRREQTDHVLGKIAFLGRKYGFVALALSQAGDVMTLGRIRDLFPTKIAFRLGSTSQVDAVLGDGASGRGARCHELDELRDRGVGYISYGGRPKAFRAAMVTDSDTKFLARGELPPTVHEVADAREYRQTWVYRHWGRQVQEDGLVDEDERLLYVGIANDLERREEQHGKDKPWMRGEPDNQGNRWAHVRVETRDADTFPRRSLAETQEVILIGREKPLYNDQHNGDNPDRVDWRGRAMAKMSDWRAS